VAINSCPDIKQFLVHHGAGILWRSQQHWSLSPCRRILSTSSYPIYLRSSFSIYTNQLLKWLSAFLCVSVRPYVFERIFVKSLFRIFNKMFRYFPVFVIIRQNRRHFNDDQRKFRIVCFHLSSQLRQTLFSARLATRLKKHVFFLLLRPTVFSVRWSLILKGQLSTRHTVWWTVNVEYEH